MSKPLERYFCEINTKRILSNHGRRTNFNVGKTEVWTVFWYGRKHCGKRRKCWLPAFSPSPTMFLKSSLLRIFNNKLLRMSNIVDLRSDLIYTVRKSNCILFFQLHQNSLGQAFNGKTSSINCPSTSQRLYVFTHIKGVRTNKIIIY